LILLGKDIKNHADWTAAELLYPFINEYKCLRKQHLFLNLIKIATFAVRNTGSGAVG
jgi:hypothetical protein